MSQQYNKPIVFYSNGNFLILRAEDAKLLRRRRILSQTVASAAPSSQPAGPPYCISHYAAHVIATHELASFVQLTLKQEISLADNKANFANKLIQVTKDEKELHMMRRTMELRRHNVPATPENLGDFNESKMRMAINETPDRNLSSFDEQLLSEMDIQSIIINQHLRYEDRMKLRIYHDLYTRGFYVSSGLKFGCDFLAYMGDPIRFHAQYAIRLVACDSKGCVDLSKNDINNLNCLQRLSHTANKIPLYTTVDSAPLPKVRYWTLKERVYLNPGSSSGDLDRVDPRLELSSYEQIKTRRTS